MFRPRAVGVRPPVRPSALVSLEARCRDIMEGFDLDGDGKISLEELFVASRGLGIPDDEARRGAARAARGGERRRAVMVARRRGGERRRAARGVRRGGERREARARLPRRFSRRRHRRLGGATMARPASDGGGGGGEGGERATEEEEEEEESALESSEGPSRTDRRGASSRRTTDPPLREVDPSYSSSTTAALDRSNSFESGLNGSNRESDSFDS